MSDGEQAMVRVRCACGWETAGPEDEVVEATQDHGRRIHNMIPTRDQVLEMVIDDGEAASPAIG